MFVYLRHAEYQQLPLVRMRSRCACNCDAQDALEGVVLLQWKQRFLTAADASKYAERSLERGLAATAAFNERQQRLKRAGLLQEHLFAALVAQQTRLQRLQRT